MSERVIPGTSIREVSEGLISVPPVGAIAAKLVGTACKGPTTPQFFAPSEVQKFLDTYGPADPIQYSVSTGTNPPMELTLSRAGQLLFTAAPPGGIWACRAETGSVAAVCEAVHCTNQTAGVGNITFTAKESGAWYNNFYYRHNVDKDDEGNVLTGTNTLHMTIPSIQQFDSSLDTSLVTGRVSANIFTTPEVSFEYYAASGNTALITDFVSQWTESRNSMLNQYWAVSTGNIGTGEWVAQQTTSILLSIGTTDTGGTNWSTNDNAAIATGPISAALELMRAKEARVTVIGGASESTDFSGMIGIGQAHVGNASRENYEQMYVCGIGNYASQDAMVTSVITASDLNLADERVIKIAPGLKMANPYKAQGTYDSWMDTDVYDDDYIYPSGGYAAALVAGVICQNIPDQSPLKKTIPGISGLEFDLTRSNQKILIRDGFLPIVNDIGYVIQRAITTAPAGEAFYQIATRMAVDDVKRAIRAAARPFIGKKINGRIMSILKRNFNSALKGYARREIIQPNYQVEVTSTREQQIAGIVAVTMIIQPIFYIEFIEVDLILE